MSTEITAESGVLTDHVVDKLEQLILEGHYRPGEKLREQSLAEELGVSRGPLREAIRTLEGRRLLERTPRSGVQVIGLSEDDLEKILITREALEGMAARYAAENMTVSEVNALKQTVAMLDAGHEGTTAAVFTGGADNDFHRLIAQGCRNRWLANILVKDVYSLLRLYRLQAARRPDVADSLDEHRAIIERIHARDGEGAEAAMRAHLRNARERILKLVKVRAPQ
ncbi:GntR family transcriptional regulator [Cupriavidus necator]|uniref:GntR family transcriptional regulator n=1 Tax=Cupriavidus necator TaxID=106590 RepID=UPI00339D6175